MKTERLFIVLFVCMGVLLAMMYGLFELGGWEMGTRGKMLVRIIVFFFVVVTAGVIIFFVCDFGDGSNGSVCLYENEIACEVSNVFIMRGRNDVDNVPQGTQAIFYMGDDCLEELADTLDSLKYIHFLGRRHEISKSLYVKLVEKNVSVICKGGVLSVVDGDNSFFVRTSRKAEELEKKNSVEISEQIDISSGAK